MVILRTISILEGQKEDKGMICSITPPIKSKTHIHTQKKKKKKNQGQTQPQSRSTLNIIQTPYLKLKSI
jgi:hypothetical protein